MNDILTKVKVFFAKVLAWVKAHLWQSAVIGAAFLLIVATAITLPIALGKNSKKNSMFAKEENSYILTNDYIFSVCDSKATGKNENAVILNRGVTIDLGGKTLDMNGYAFRIASDASDAKVVLKNGTLANGVLHISVPNGDVDFENLTVAENVTYELTAKPATIVFKQSSVKGEGTVKSNSNVIVDGSSLQNIALDGAATFTAQNGAKIESITIGENAKDAKVNIDSSVMVAELKVESKAEIHIAGTVNALVVEQKAEGASVEVAETAYVPTFVAKTDITVDAASEQKITVTEGVKVTGENVKSEVKTEEEIGKQIEDSPALHEHVYDRMTASEDYLKSPATCTAKAVYYKSCSCGKAGTETFVSGEMLSHSYGEWIKDTEPTVSVDGSQHRICSACDAREDGSIPSISPKGKVFVFSEYVIESSGATEADWTLAKAEEGKESFTNDEFATWILKYRRNTLTEISTYTFAANAQSVTQSASEGESVISMDYLYEVSGNTLVIGELRLDVTGADTFRFAEHACGEEGNEKIFMYAVYRVKEDSSAHEHLYDRQIVSEDYLYSAATCTAPASYFYSCACGACGIQSFASGTALGHTYDTYTGKCTRPGCDGKVCVTLTSEDNSKDYTFTPYGDKIYFNFKTIYRHRAYFDTETQQGLKTPITDETPCLIQSIALYKDGEFEQSLAFDNYDCIGDDYFSWTTQDSLDPDTAYYCVVTLDRSDYENFALYVYGIDKGYPDIELVHDDYLKWEDGTPFVIEAEDTECGRPVITEYVPIADFSDDPDVSVPWTKDAPTLPGYYVVRLTVEETDTVHGDRRLLDDPIEIRAIPEQALNVNVGKSITAPKGYIEKVSVTLEAGKEYVFAPGKYNVFDYVLEGYESVDLQKSFVPETSGKYVIAATKTEDGTAGFGFGAYEVVYMSDPYYDSANQNRVSVAAGDVRVFRFSLNGDTAIQLKNIPAGNARISGMDFKPASTFTNVGGVATSEILQAGEYYLCLMNLSKEAQMMDATITCAHSKLYGNCICVNCESDARLDSRTLTPDEDSRLITFLPQSGMILFQFKTVAECLFYLDTEDEQGLEHVIDEDTPCLFKSVLLYKDGDWETPVEMNDIDYIGEDYFYWQSAAYLEENTKYYCVVTLNPEIISDDSAELFRLYFQGIERKDPGIVWETTDWTKDYDGKAIQVTATAEHGTVQYEYFVEEEWVSEAPENAGSYTVKAYVDDAEYYGELSKIYTVEKALLLPKDFICLPFNGLNHYCITMTRENCDGYADGEDNGFFISISNHSGIVLPGNYHLNSSDWTLNVLPGSSVNYEVDIDGHNFAITVEKIPVALTATFSIALGSTELSGTNMITAEQCTGVCETVPFGMPKFSITIPGETAAGIYRLSDLTDATADIASTSYTLSDESNITVIVYTEEINRSALQGSALSYQAGETKYFKFNPLSAGTYMLEGEDSFHTSINGLTPVYTYGNRHYYSLASGYDYFILGESENTAEHRISLERLGDASSILNASGMVGDYDGGKTYEFTFTIADAGIYMLTDDECITASILGKTPEAGHFYNLEAGLYILNIECHSTEWNQVVTLEETEAPDISEQAVKSDGYTTDYEADADVYYRVTVEKSGFYDVYASDELEVTVIGVREAYEDGYYLVPGTYYLNVQSTSGGEELTVSMDCKTEAVAKDITAEVNAEGSYYDESVTDGETYYYYIDVQRAGIYEFSLDDGEGSLVLYNCDEIWGDEIAYAIPSAGRYYIELYVENADGSIQIDVCSYALYQLNAGDTKENIKIGEGEIVCFKTDCLSAVTYSITTDTTLEIEHIDADCGDIEVTDGSFTMEDEVEIYIYAINNGEATTHAAFGIEAE